MRTPTICRLLAPMIVSVLHVQANAESLFDSAPLSDEQLGDARGGFQLPNGINVDFGVLISTRVDGAQVLQTELRVVGDSITANVLALTGQQAEPAEAQASTVAKDAAKVFFANFAARTDGRGGTIPSGGTGSSAEHNGASPKTGGFGVEGTLAGATAQVGSLDLATGQGSVQITVPDVAADLPASTDQVGAPAMTAPRSGDSAPTVGQTVAAGGPDGILATVELPDLFVQHAIGRQISSTVANTGNGRVINSELSINLRLEDVQPFALGSGGFRVHALGLEAAIWRAVGG